MVLRLFLILSVILPSVSGAEIVREQVSFAYQLQKLLMERADSLEISLQPGIYYLFPENIVDSTCGNCEKPEELVPATAGLRVSGSYVKLSGPPDLSAVIHTNAGYGIFFKQCGEGIIESLTVTGGKRDSDARATDAAVVVKQSTVTIRDCLIRDNIGDSSTVVDNVVGIMGVCGREHSNLTIENNRIVRNSWDGIALYRGARATISNNLVDGVDKAAAQVAGGGRGVAVGITWDAEATLERNLLKRYWKGVGIFVDAAVTARNNIIEDMLTWGIAYSDADKGIPVGVIENNIIYSTGACGATITRSKPGENPGRFVGNVIVRTAQNPKYDSPDYYCHQCALSVVARPENYEIGGNIFYDNREATDDLPDMDLTLSEFRESVAAMVDTLLMTPLFEQSDFAYYVRRISSEN
jgi:parallel beta-helix repeat protein